MGRKAEAKDPKQVMMIAKQTGSKRESRNKKKNGGVATMRECLLGDSPKRICSSTLYGREFVWGRRE